MALEVGSRAVCVCRAAVFALGASSEVNMRKEPYLVEMWLALGIMLVVLLLLAAINGG